MYPFVAVWRMTAKIDRSCVFLVSDFRWDGLWTLDLTTHKVANSYWASLGDGKLYQKKAEPYCG